MAILDIILLLFSGVIISTIAIAVGIGGGILWTPILLLGFGLTPSEAIATSLAIQIIGLGSGSLAYMRTSVINVKLTLFLALAALPGLVIGSQLTASLPQDIIQLSFGIMAMVLAIYFLVGQEAIAEKAIQQIPSLRSIRPLLPITGLLAVLMGFLSVGIGEWLIPMLKRRFNLSMHQAVATIIPLMFILALSATLIHSYSNPQIIHWDLLIWGGTGTIIGGQLGAYFGQRVKEHLLKDAFIYIMTLIGIHLIFQSI